MGTSIQPSTQKNIDMVLEWFGRADIGTIGVQGKRGIGKSWTLRHIMDKAVASSLFDFVIWVDVGSLSYGKELQDMQIQIVDQLPVHCCSEVVNLRQKISMSLTDKRFLLILDEITLTFSCNLEDLGVPLLEQQKKASKVIFIGESKNIVTNKILYIDVLPEKEAWQLFCEKSGIENDTTDILELAKPLLNDCGGVPLQIITTAGALGKPKGDTMLTLEARLRKGTEVKCILDYHGFLYYMLPSKVVKDCFLYCTLYPRYHHINMKELITSWILEGYLDECTCLEKAYEKGLCVLQELIDRYLLLTFDQYHVTMHDINMSAYVLQERHEIVLAKASLWYFMRWMGLEQESFKKICLMNGNLQSKYPVAPEFLTPSMVMLHGDRGHISSELTDAFFEPMQNLQVLAILHAKIRYLPLSLSILKNLKALVLRGCDSLENLNHIKGLHNLVMLSLSGSSNLKEIPDDFFEHMRGLKVLDLSKTQLKELPSSFSKLYGIRRLILQGCSNLEKLPYHASLKVLDLSGASKLRKIPQEYFRSRLLMLDLSGTLVDHLPSISNLHELRHLLLSGCSKITTLTCPEAFDTPKVLDLSGASAFKEFQDEPPCSSNKLHIIDLSETQIVKLPPLSGCRNLRKLLLRNCSYLQRLPSFHSGVEVLDLSSSIAFGEFDDLNFGKGLQSLDLSATRVVKLPSFSQCSNLCRLLLNNCVFLEEFRDDAFKNLHKLQMLNLSGTKLGKLPNLSKCTRLQGLILRNCSNLKQLPELKGLERLEVLELSGATTFRNFEDEYLENCLLRKLKLSGTEIVKLPSLSKCKNLCKLILRGCSNLKTMPHLEALTRLREVDLSGATSLTELQDESFEQMCDLRKLDLSGTQIADLPRLSGCVNLCQLILRGCLNLNSLPHIKSLTRLKILDLSGDTAFREFQDESFGQNYDLEILDLSETQIVKVPFISGCVNLCKLLLRGCLNLETLPNLKPLAKLEVLDLSGSNEFKQFEDDSFAQNNAIKTLSLSGTKVTDFSFVSRCTNLYQLSLQACLNLENLSFEGLHYLNKLDLSEAHMKQLPSSLLELSNLTHLILKGCPNLEKLPHVEVFEKLEVLDLSRLKIAKFPYGIPKLTHLWFLAIRNRKCIWELDWENKMEVNKQQNWNSSNISSHSSKLLEDIDNTYIHITVSDADIFRYMDIYLFSQRFHLCLCSLEEKLVEDDIYMQGNEYVFSDIYHQRSQLSQSDEEPDKFFKICGFQNFPNGIEKVLSHVELLYLKKNAFVTRLSDVGGENVKLMNECWIERCDRMECVFHQEEKEQNLALGQNLQGLWISNLSELSSLFRGAVQSESFACLKHLYIDCCPGLIVIFTSEMRLENLVTLSIKYCDNFLSVFRDGDMVSGQETVPQLQTLTLWKLPALQHVCGGVLRSLNELAVNGCPNLHKLPVDSTSPRIEIEGEQEWWTKLWGNESIPSNLSFIPLDRFL